MICNCRDGIIDPDCPANGFMVKRESSTYYQIGTSEPNDCVGSRAARSSDLDDAIEECRQYSLSPSIKMAWLRTVENGRLGDVLVTFVKGHKQRP